MSEIFSTALIVVGFLLAGIGLIGSLTVSDFIIFGLFILGVGLAQICLGFSMQKLSEIEDKIARYIFDDKIEDELIQARCEKCGRRYDADVDECPYCEAERLKHRYRNF